MNKAAINREMGYAYQALANVGIACSGKINKTYRGQISSFGAAITMGSLLPAIAFFSNRDKASVDRSKLMDAILAVLKHEKEISERTLFDYALAHEECKEDIINAAIALKLAMNLYILE